MLAALQGLRAGNEGAPARAAPREGDDLVRRNAADRGGPGGIFRLPIALVKLGAAAEEIGLERLPAGAEPVEEGAVVQPLAGQGMREPQHQCDIGAGADRMPDRLDPCRQIIAQRADQVKFDTARVRRGEAVAGDVLAGAAAADIVVFERHAAKGEDQRALRRPARPS